MDTTATPSPLPPPVGPAGHTAAPSSPTPTPPPTPPPAPPHRAPAPTSPGRHLGAGHIVAIVVGCLLLLPGLGMMTGGGFAVVAQVAATDDGGYFEFTLDRVDTDGVAIAATDIWLDGDSGDADWLLDWLDVDVRLQVAGARSTDEVFVGIARSDDVRRYLEGASYSEIVEINGRSPLYRTASGTRSVGSPLEQDFWTVSATGDGVQEIEWEARGGRWSAVVMNADGSPVVAADVDVALKSGVFLPIAITLLVAGVLVTTTAVVLIVIGARGRRSPGDGSPLDPPDPDTAVEEGDTASNPLGVG